MRIVENKQSKSSDVVALLRLRGYERYYSSGFPALFLMPGGWKGRGYKFPVKAVFFSMSGKTACSGFL